MYSDKNDLKSNCKFQIVVKGMSGQISSYYSFNGECQEMSNYWSPKLILISHKYCVNFISMLKSLFSELTAKIKNYAWP